jgi:drug/metabolite transporter (DMT)-like permease
MRLIESKTTAGPSAAFVAIAALCWGLSGGIGAILLAEGWSPFIVAFYRGAIGFLFVLLWLALQPYGSGLGDYRLWFWSLLAGLGITGNFVFYFLSIETGSVTVAATLMYCAPVFVYLVSFALKLEQATPIKWAAIVLVLIGILLLTGAYDVQLNEVRPISAAAGMLSGLSYAVFIFGFKYAGPHGSPQTILVIAFGLVAILLFWMGKFDETLSVPGTPDWPMFLLLGILGAGLSFILYIIGLNHTSPAVASIVAMVEPVTASLFGILILSETLVMPQLFGMAVILITVTTLSVHSGTHRMSIDRTND